MEIGRLHCVRGYIIRRDLSKTIGMVKDYVSAVCATAGKPVVSTYITTALLQLSRCASQIAGEKGQQQYLICNRS